MPQASDEDRAKWGGYGGVGEDKAISFLLAAGYTLTRQSTWLKPSPDHIVTEDESGAMWFLIEEWDYAGLDDRYEID
jgi:hypothetical protein